MVPAFGLKVMDLILAKTASIPSWLVPNISTIPSSVTESH